MSLRHRVIATFLLVALVLIGANAILAATFRSFLADRLDRQLVSTASTLANRSPPRGERLRCFTDAAGQEEVFTEYFIACGSPDAQVFRRVSSPLREDDPVLERNKLLASTGPGARAPQPYTAPSESGDAEWRIVAVTNRFTDQVYVIGVTLDQFTATLHRIRFVQLIASGAVLAALAALSWWMIRLGVHPIESMAETAGAISGGDLTKRVGNVDERTEVGRLGRTFNTMLERIEEAFRAREASEARVRRFAADASHELRTPLTSIRGYAELYRAGGLRAKGALDDAMRRIEDEATRMGDLVEDLLLLARLDQRRPSERAPVRLDRLAEDGVRDARATEPARDITLEAQPVTVDGDEAGLRQVIANLLANARVHTPVDAGVRVSVGQANGHAYLEVADDGPGMPPDVAARVFERFYRADPSRVRTAGGTGLGLSIVDAIANAHGGRASVDSTAGQGARFRIEFPALQADS